MHRSCKENTKYQTAAQFIADHENLEQWLREIAARAATSKFQECEFVWSAFTVQLENHMEIEEQALFSNFAQSGAAGAAATVQALLAEHAAICKQLEAMESDLRYHLKQHDEVQSLLALLRAHEQHEQETLYPWFAAQKGASTASAPSGGASTPLKGVVRWRN